MQNSALFSVWSDGTLPAPLGSSHCHQKVGKTDNGIERTYFMADICQKSGLQPVGLFRFIAEAAPELCLCFFLDRYVASSPLQFQSQIGRLVGKSAWKIYVSNSIRPNPSARQIHRSPSKKRSVPALAFMKSSTSTGHPGCMYENTPIISVSGVSWLSPRFLYR